MSSGFVTIRKTADADAWLRKHVDTTERAGFTDRAIRGLLEIPPEGQERAGVADRFRGRVFKKKADVSGSELAPNTGKPKGEIADERSRERGLQAVKYSPTVQNKLAQEEEGRPILRRGIIGGALGAGLGAGGMAGTTGWMRRQMANPEFAAKMTERAASDPRMAKTLSEVMAKGGVGKAALMGAKYFGPVGAGIGLLSGALSKGSSLEKEAFNLADLEAAKSRVKDIEGLLGETGEKSVRAGPLLREMQRLQAQVAKHEPRLQTKFPDYFSPQRPHVTPPTSFSAPGRAIGAQEAEEFSKQVARERAAASAAKSTFTPPGGSIGAEEAERFAKQVAEERAAKTAVPPTGGKAPGFLGKALKFMKQPAFYIPAAGALAVGGGLLAAKKLRERDQGMPKAASLAIRKVASLQTGFFADPANRRYPLDSLDDVMEANAYMDKYASEFDPRTRRSVATAIYKRSEQLGIPASRSVREIAIKKVASVGAVRGHLEAREVYYGRDTEAGKVCELLKTKVASTNPEVLAEAIAVMDAKHGGDKVWGSWLPEPWECVFEKSAEDETKDVSNYAYDAGSFRVSGTDLVMLANHSPEVDRRFGKEFAVQFRADPIQFFDHLPMPEKKVLSQMAHDQYGSGAPLPIQR